MGNSSNKSVNSLLKYISENDLKDKNKYNEFFYLRDFQNDSDFNEIKKKIQNLNNVSSLFEFFIYTLNKCTKDANEKNVRECKICIKLLLCILPCMQCNYNKKDIFKLFWERDYFNFTTYELSYNCDNILILHIFNLLLILLFTENLCIKKCNNETEIKIQQKFVKNTIDVQKLWARHILIDKIGDISEKEEEEEEEEEENKGEIEETKDKKEHVPEKNVKKETNSIVQKEHSSGEETNKKSNVSISESEIKWKHSGTSDLKKTKIKRFNTSNSRNSQLHKEHVNLNNNDIDLEMIKTRIDILKCLLILLSSYMYYNNRNYLKEQNLFLFFFTSGEIYFTSNFFLSLINVIYDIEFNYFSSFFYNDIYSEYYNLCLHLLNILIDFNPFVLEGEKKIHYMNNSVKYFYKLIKKMRTQNESLDISDIEKEQEKKATLNFKKEDSEKRNERVYFKRKLNTALTVPDDSNENNMISSSASCPSCPSFPSSSSFKTITFIEISEGSCSPSENDHSDYNATQNNNENRPRTSENRESINLEKDISKEDESENSDNSIVSEKEKIIDYFYCNNVFFIMFRELNMDNIKYIYNAVLNMLISFKMYSETYDDSLIFLENYILLLWNFLDHNENFINFMKTHNSNIFVYHITYLLLFFNSCRKKEIQICTILKKEKNETFQVSVESIHTESEKKKKVKNEEITEEKNTCEEKNEYDYFFNNEQFLKSNKSDDFGVRKIDGLIYICLFIMMKISSKRRICKNLNEKCETNPKMKIHFLKHITEFDTYTDFFVYTLCTLINDNIYFLKFERIVDMVLTILTNISVYIKALGVIPCECIILVIKKILKKEWILSSDQHFYSLFLLLDFINNILSYNLCKNYNLIYTIIKNKEVFFLIHSLHEHFQDSFYPDTSDSSSELLIFLLAVINFLVSHLLSLLFYWIPTQKWLLSWQKKLPMHFLNNIIYDLANMVEEECNEKEILNYEDVVSLIQNHCKSFQNKKIPFVLRKYDRNISLSMWFTSYLYFLIFYHFYKNNLFINNGVTFIF